MARLKKTDSPPPDDSLLFTVAPIKIEPTTRETPLMTQYYQMKGQYPDAIMLFRVGDFYETFGEDAVTTAGVLGITLTSRNNGGNDVPLAGFPYHSLDTYLPRLVRGGYRVAICEQLEKPSKEKKIVRRGVTEMVTPGIAISDNLLNYQQNNFLATLHFSNTNLVGIALVDLSTGEFFVSEGDVAYIDKLLQFDLRARSADNALYEVEPTESPSLLRLTTPVLPAAERRLLSALGNLTVDQSAGRFEALLPVISLDQVAATLATLGLQPRGSMT